MLSPLLLLVDELVAGSHRADPASTQTVDLVVLVVVRGEDEPAIVEIAFGFEMDPELVVTLLGFFSRP